MMIDIMFNPLITILNPRKLTKNDIVKSLTVFMYDGSTAYIPYSAYITYFNVKFSGNDDVYTYLQCTSNVISIIYNDNKYNALCELKVGETYNPMTLTKTLKERDMTDDGIFKITTAHISSIDFL